MELFIVCVREEEGGRGGGVMCNLQAFVEMASHPFHELKTLLLTCTESSSFP